MSDGANPGRKLGIIAIILGVVALAFGLSRAVTSDGIWNTLLWSGVAMVLAGTAMRRPASARTGRIVLLSAAAIAIAMSLYSSFEAGRRARLERPSASTR